MAEIILFQFAGDIGAESASPFCVKVHRALCYKNLTYAVRNVGAPSELKRLNAAARKLPVIQVGETFVADSSRILDWLDEQHPEPPFQPEDVGARAQVSLLEDWADESLYWFAVYCRWQIESNFRPFSKRAFGKLPVPLRWIVPKVARKSALTQLAGQGLGRVDLDTVLANFKAHLEMLEQLLGSRSFLVGEMLTRADIAVFAPLRAVSILETSPEMAPLVRKHEALVSWLKRVDEATSGDHTVSFSA